MDASVVVARCHDGHVTRAPPSGPPSPCVAIPLTQAPLTNPPADAAYVSLYFLGVRRGAALLRPLRSPCCVCCVPWEYTARIHNREAGESFEYLRGRQGAV